MPNENLLDPSDFYDIMAPYYDSFIEQTRLSYLPLEEEKAFLESIVRDRKTILDLGCGTGRTVKLLSDGRRQLVGIDISSGMLRIAREVGANVVLASAFHLPFADNLFDVILGIHIGFGFCANQLEMEQLALESYRVLKPGGKIMLDTPHGKVRGDHYVTSWTAGNRVIKAMSYGKNEDEIYRVLDNAGFTQIIFFGGYGQTVELQADSRRIIVAATKL